MPYIKPGRRKELRSYDFGTFLAENAGELNYQITTLIINYWLYCTQKTKNYQRINDIIGALEGAKLEFYRRIVANYENQKIIENGDVYDS